MVITFCRPLLSSFCDDLAPKLYAPAFALIGLYHHYHLYVVHHLGDRETPKVRMMLQADEGGWTRGYVHRRISKQLTLQQRIVTDDAINQQLTPFNLSVASNKLFALISEFSNNTPARLGLILSCHPSNTCRDSNNRRPCALTTCIFGCLPQSSVGFIYRQIKDSLLT